jgi:hypothetical protein
VAQVEPVGGKVKRSRLVPATFRVRAPRPAAARPTATRDGPVGAAAWFAIALGAAVVARSWPLR